MEVNEILQETFREFYGPENGPRYYQYFSSGDLRCSTFIEPIILNRIFKRALHLVIKNSLPDAEKKLEKTINQLANFRIYSPYRFQLYHFFLKKWPGYKEAFFNKHDDLTIILKSQSKYNTKKLIAYELANFNKQ